MESDMKKYNHHILSILIIILMIILGVSTTAKPPREIKNRISYETRGEYFLFKIKTRMNPSKYGLFGHAFHTSFFDIIYENEERQRFSIDQWGRLVTYRTSEVIILNDGDLETFTEGGYFIISIKKELLNYENPALKRIMLVDKEGKYVHEIYIE